MTPVWSRFFLQYLVIAAVGTAVIHFGSGLLTIPSPDNAPTTPHHPPALPTPELPSLPVAPPVQEPLPMPPPVTPLPDPDAMPPLGPDTTSPDTGTAAQVPPEPEPEPETCWGVVRKDETRAYSLDGRFLQKLPAGTTLEYETTRESPSVGTMAVASIVQGNQRFAPVLLPLADVDSVPGPLAEANPDQLGSLIDRARLLAKIDSRIKELKAVANKKNPYASKYTKAVETYNAFWKEVEALQKKRDTTSGATHMAASDELRRRKGQNIELTRQLEEIKSDYLKWKESQGGNLPADKTLDGLKAQLETLNAKIHKLEFTR